MEGEKQAPLTDKGGPFDSYFGLYYLSCYELVKCTSLIKSYPYFPIEQLEKYHATQLAWASAPFVNFIHQ